MQYIRTKLQVETAKNLLDKTLQTKRNEKAKLLFQKDLVKVNKIIEKQRPQIIKTLKLIAKQEQNINKEIKKITNKKCELNSLELEQNLIDHILKPAVKAKDKYYANEIKDNEETSIGIYENLINVDTEQKEIDDFVLEMILGKVTAFELDKLINKIKK